MAKSKTNRTCKPKAKPAAKKPYINYRTIWNSVGGGFSNPGQSKVFKVGNHKVLLTRSDKLNSNGNPIHTATVINKDGSLGKPYRSDGSATLVVSGALKNIGVETRHSTQKPKTNKK
ncbi:MAG: hypothetical protein ACI4MB_05755 [Candidatus Coproplasma sp.]